MFSIAIHSLHTPGQQGWLCGLLPGSWVWLLTEQGDLQRAFEPSPQSKV